MSSLCCCDRVDGCTISISDDGCVYLYGNSSYLHNNKQDLNIKQMQDLNNIKMISCGDSHIFCNDYEGNLYCLGNNKNRQLGIDKNIQKTHIPQKINLPLIKQVSCGGQFTICLSEDGLLYSFGYNSSGQLGLGTSIPVYSTPQQIPALNNIDYIVCGNAYAICKTYDCTYYSWGYNVHGQLGQGNYTMRNTPILCNNWPDNVISIKCGATFSLILTDGGYVFSFGNNLSGQLGQGSNQPSKSNIPTKIDSLSEIQRIECGDYHAMCIDGYDKLWIFGDNSFAQLGLGDKNNRFKPILHPKLSNIIDISSGGDHTFVKTIDNKIYAFGKNNHSQLGIKTSKNIVSKPIQVFKDKEDIWCSTIGKSRAKSARK